MLYVGPRRRAVCDVMVRTAIDVGGAVMDGKVAMTETSNPAAERRRSGYCGRLRLLERDHIVREFEAIFSRKLSVPSTCIVVEGPWGSGRTALMNSAYDAGRHAGAMVLPARGSEIEKRNPYAVLGRFLESASERVDGAPDPAELARLIAAVNEEMHSYPHDSTRVGALFYSVVIALRELGPVLLAVDDADLADRESMAVLQHVAHRLEDREIWLLVSTRPRYPGMGLRPVDGLLSEPGARLFTLEPLHAESVGAILADYFGQEPEPALVDVCCEATGGKPFFLSALLSALGNKRVRPTAELAERFKRLPAPRITQIVLGRLSVLPVAASDLLLATAVLGDGADPGTARDLAKIDALAAERAADAAAQAELLEPGRPFTFTSPLIRWAIYHDIPTARRSQLHARAAQLLAARGERESTVVHHLLATEPAGDESTALRLLAAGRSAQAAGDAELALSCLHRALREPPPAAQRGRVYLDLAMAEMASDSGLALSHFRRAIEAGVPDDADVVNAAVGLLKGVTESTHHRAETLKTVRGVTGRLDSVDRALQMEFELALSLASRHPAEQSRGIARIEALLAQPGDDGDAISQMARAFVTVHRMAGDQGISADVVATTLATGVDVHQLISTDPTIRMAANMACYGLLCADRFVEVDPLLQAAKERAQKQGLLFAELDLSCLMTVSRLWQGFLTGAEEEGVRGRTLRNRLDGGRWNWPSIGLVDALVYQGRLHDAQGYAESLVPDDIEDPMARAAARCELGHLQVARGFVDEGLAAYMAAGEDAARVGVVNPAYSSWRADAAMALSLRGDWDAAMRLAEEHLRLARTFGAVRTIGVGLRAVAAATPDLSTRVLRLSEAVTLLEPSPARLDAARALIELGTALVDLKKKEEARGVLRRGANLASMCGANPLVETAGTQLRAAGARPRRLGHIGPASLTPAELRVVQLAAKGKTNNDIAEDLYVTVKTVEGHLAKAFRKLGVESRRELASALDGEGDDIDRQLLGSEEAS